MAMTMSTNPFPFSTKDLYEASVLSARGMKLLRIDYSSIFGSYLFIFDDISSCQQIISKFYRREITIDALAFAESHQALKNKIRTLERGGRI